ADQVATALLISPHESDHSYFEGLFSRTNWKLHQARSSAEAVALLRQCSIPVVIIDEAPEDAGWKELLHALRQSGPLAKLLVATLMASGGLWTEVLNAGAYDILVRPFDQQEVLHSISMAWLAWKCEQNTGSHAEFFVPWRRTGA